jgi:hypothetical protein
MRAAEVCALPFHFTGTKPYDLMALHAYTALFPIAGLAAVLGVEQSFALLHAIAYAALVFLPYPYLRRRGCGVFASAAFGLLVMAYPGWSLSLGGEYYLDRFYMPAMLLLLYLLDARAHAAPAGTQRRPLRMGLLLLVAVAAALCSERAAIMVIGVLVYFLVAYPPLRAQGRATWALVAVTAALLAYLAAYFALLYQGAPGSPSLFKSLASSPTLLAARLRDPALLPFLGSNFLFAGLFAFFAPLRALLLLVGTMAPNLMIGMGGGELTGWTSHYHAMYIPFLVYVASVGYARFLGRLPRRVPGWAAAGLALLLVAVIARHFDPYTARWSAANTSPSREGGATAAMWRFFVAPQTSGEKAVADWARTLEAVVPAGAKVSAVEGAMPALYRSRLLSFYPMGIDSAEYLVISGLSKDGVITETLGAVTYLPGANAKELNACLHERVKRQGFVLVKDVSPISMLVLRRQQRPPL